MLVRSVTTLFPRGGPVILLVDVLPVSPASELTDSLRDLSFCATESPRAITPRIPPRTGLPCRLQLRVRERSSSSHCPCNRGSGLSTPHPCNPLSERVLHKMSASEVICSKTALAVTRAPLAQASVAACAS